mgnify:CR=1 FL=1
MTTAGRRGILAVVVAIALLALGAGLGVVAGGALGIHSENAAQMTPSSPSTPSIAPAVPPPAELVVQAPRSARMDAATDELAAAVASAAGTGAPATLTVTAGCDKRFQTCVTRFANAANFRGFPHIPGNDFVVRYPVQGEPGNDGGSLRR